MKIRVAVLFGGVSVEHEVSVISGLQALHALDNERFDPFPVYLTKDGKWFVGEGLCDITCYSHLPSLLSHSTEVTLHPKRGASEFVELNPSFLRTRTFPADVFFPVFHGTFGEDGSVQGLFELMNVAYVGCGVASAAASMDKVLMKEIFRGNGLPVVPSYWFYSEEYLQNPDEILSAVDRTCNFPCIIKPALLGSSVGLQVVRKREEFEEKLLISSAFCPKILVEKYLGEMFELNCSVIGGQTYQRASVLEKPLSSGEILSFKDKYEQGGGSKGKSSLSAMDRIIPADVDAELTARVQEYAKQAFRALGCSGVARMDFMVDKRTGELFANELNSIPGSLSFYLWEHSGLGFSELVNELIEIALENYRVRQKTLFTHETNLFAIHGKGTSNSKSGKLR